MLIPGSIRKLINADSIVSMVICLFNCFINFTRSTIYLYLKPIYLFIHIFNCFNKNLR